MALTERDQEHLGIDTNVLVAYLDQDHPDHVKVSRLSNRKVALNPTVIHEAYHALVFKLKWNEDEASEVLKEAVNDENNIFINQSLTTTLAGLEMASEHHLGGRDALILANFLGGKIRKLLTLDEDLLKLKTVKYGKERLEIIRP